MIQDQSLQEEMHLNTGFFKRSLEGQLVDLRQAVTTIQVSPESWAPGTSICNSHA
jgi:hypothetical protein